MGEVGRDDPLEKAAVPDEQPDRAAGARVGQSSVIHYRNFQVNQPGAANRTHQRGFTAVEDGREAGNSGLGIMLKYQIGVVQTGLRPHEGWVIGDFERQRPAC